MKFTAAEFGPYQGIFISLWCMIRNHYNKISENPCQFEENSKPHYLHFRRKKLKTVFLETSEGAIK